MEEQVLQSIRAYPEVILESIQAYQQKKYEQLQQAQQAFLQEMKANPQEVIRESPTTGADEQRIVLLEFSDFQCLYCAKMHQRLKQFIANHQHQVTLVYKHLPLSAHSEALPAAKAAWAANQQGKFWHYHDALFTQQKKLGEALYVGTAKSLNLDIKQFNRDRYSDGANNVWRCSPLEGIPEFPGLVALIRVESERQLLKHTIIEVSMPLRANRYDC